MCGLAGELRIDGVPVDTQALERMTHSNSGEARQFWVVQCHPNGGLDTDG